MPVNVGGYEITKEMGDYYSRLSIAGNYVTDGLVLYLDAGISDSYPGSGTTWFDLSGNENNGTLKNGPIFSNDRFSFDGSNDWVSTDLGSEVDYLFSDSTNQFTVITWFKPSGTDSIICGAAGGIGSGTTFAQYMSGTTFAIRIRGTSTDNTVKTNLSTSDFHMGTYTWNGTSGLGYYNDEPPVNVGIGTASNQSRKFGIADPDEGGVANYPRFSGDITAVKVYNRALSATEITQNYNAVKNRYGI